MISFYWGNSTMRFLRFMSLYSASKLNPAEQIRLYRKRSPEIAANDSPVEPKYDYMRHLSKLSNLEIVWLEDVLPGFSRAEPNTADTIKYYHLAEFGGTVSDMDIIYFKPLPPITHDVEYVEFYNVLPVGFFRGRPCVFWKKMFEQALTGGCTADAKWGTGLQACGVGMFNLGNPLFEKTAGTCSQRKLSRSLVYPFVPEEYAFDVAENIFFLQDVSLKNFPEDSVGFHYWGGDTLSRSCISKYNHTNYYEYPSTMATIISSVLAPNFNFD